MIQVLPYGDRAILLEVADTTEMIGLVDQLRADRAVASLVSDIVPGACTVLLIAAPGIALDRLRAVVPAVTVASTAESEPIRRVRREIPVIYDGPDLEWVAEHTGLGVAGVIAAHTAGEWRVAFGGFAPGFGYLSGGDRRLSVPRLDRPRPTVPAGAVGLAGAFTGVYPRSSPGGWRLIGRTDAVMWDLDSDEPALLVPGAAVRFRQVAP